jgi:hypothetical protein
MERVEFSENAGEDQRVFETLACASALMGTASVGDIAKEAD